MTVVAGKMSDDAGALVTGYSALEGGLHDPSSAIVSIRVNLATVVFLHKLKRVSEVVAGKARLGAERAASL